LLLHPKPYIQEITTPVHGGITSSTIAKIHHTNLEVLDFSTCCNPYTFPFSLNKTVHSLDLSQYPDPNSSLLVDALSENLGIPTQNIIAGNGSTELIRLAATAYFNHEDTIVITSPSYSEYELACWIVNAKIKKYVLTEKSGFGINIDSFIAFANRYKPSGIFLCNPNNPTGHYLERQEILKVIDTFRESLIILDEAYIGFTGKQISLNSIIKHQNVLIIRSMTKKYALAGVRLGYAAADRKIITALLKVRPPWNVNSIAQVAGVAALSNKDYLRNSMLKIQDSANYLKVEISKLGFEVVPSDTNFFIFKVGNAKSFQRKLLGKGILVRDCTSFGLPQYIRIAPRNKRECIQLIKTISQLKEGGEC
jgi:histidinol-phosphate aminotransferase